MARCRTRSSWSPGPAPGSAAASPRRAPREGAKVVVSDVHENPNPGGFEEDAALTTVEAIEKGGGRAVYVGCDVTSSDQVAALIAEAVRAFGRLDVMVNNAGVYRNGKRLHEFDEEDLDVCFEVNAKGTFFGAKEAIKQMLAQGDGGVIINLVSTAGLQGHPNQSVYNISKGAQANLTRCLAIEYGKDRIRVNGICPTYAKTSLTRRAVRRQGLRPGLHRVDPAQALGRGRRHRQPGGVPGLRRVELHPRRPDQGRRRGDTLPLLGLSRGRAVDTKDARGVGAPGRTRTCDLEIPRPYLRAVPRSPGKCH